MPHINIWIRKDDYDSWEAIKDKPTFLHNALSIKDTYLSLSTPEKKLVKKDLVALKNKYNSKERTPDAYILSPKIAKENPELVEQFDKLAKRVKKGPIELLCKIHGIPLDNRGKCLQKNCKYA